MSFHNWLQNLRNRYRGPQRRRQTSRLRPNLECLEDRAVPASFSISDVSILEGNFGSRNALVTVSVTGANNSSVSVGYTTASGSAVAGSDYQALSGTLSFGKNVTSKTILVPIYGDTAVESDETFSVNLRNPKKATITNGQGVVTILNDDTRISIGNVYLSEGNSGTTSFNFSVNLSHVVNEPVTVSYATADDTAVAGSDYVAASGTVTIPAGQTSGTITVLVNGDRLSEFDERYYVNLSNPTIGTIVDNQGFGYIYDDEPHIYISSPAAGEGNSGTTAFVFTVLLTSASDDPVTVDFATADRFATTADGDYAATSGTLTFNPGVTSQTITVQVNGDLTVEADEDFLVNLSNPTNAGFDISQAWGTILNDDANDNAVLHIYSASGMEWNPNVAGTTDIAFEVWLSTTFYETVTVDFYTADGSASAWNDYFFTEGTLTFTPGVTSQIIYVTVVPDWEGEWNETFYVILSNPSSNALIEPGWDVGTGTIYDNVFGEPR